MAKVGRPTKYRKKYCQEIIEFMKTGKSLAAYAAHIGVPRTRIHAWRQKNPEFQDACEIAIDYSLAWWENLMMMVATGQNRNDIIKNGKTVKNPYRNANKGMIIFVLSRRFQDYYQKNKSYIQSLDKHEESDDQKVQHVEAPIDRATAVKILDDFFERKDMNHEKLKELFRSEIGSK